MAKIEVLSNKRLVLKNTLIYEVKDIKLEEIEKHGMIFENKIKSLKVQTFGPLITKNYGMNIKDDGIITTNYDFIVQAHDYLQYKDIFKAVDRYEVSNCVYAHFEDRAEFINFAYSKLDVFFYENDLEPEGSIYSILLEQTENYMKMDIFKPVKTL